jgi:hypothetical protein
LVEDDRRKWTDGWMNWLIDWWIVEWMNEWTNERALNIKLWWILHISLVVFPL